MHSIYIVLTGNKRLIAQSYGQTSVVKYFPNMHEALGTIPSTSSEKPKQPNKKSNINYSTVTFKFTYKFEFYAKILILLLSLQLLMSVNYKQYLCFLLPNLKIHQGALSLVKSCFLHFNKNHNLFLNK